MALKCVLNQNNAKTGTFEGLKDSKKENDNVQYCFEFKWNFLSGSTKLLSEKNYWKKAIALNQDF